jgi:D-alanyl-D-alanine dipeptidase
MSRPLVATSFLLCLAAPVLAIEIKSTKRVEPGSRKDEPMVDLEKFAPRIAIELRYKTNRNLAKRPVYPKNARCYLRKSVAERLVRAQEWLEVVAPRGTRLKIWDGWRPAWAHNQLWKVMPNAEFLGDPNDPRTGGSLHTWGACVDATLVDKDGRDLRMPTDFDVFTPEARTYYQGNDREIRRNLRLLHSAMSKGGFLVVYDEWWHFVARDWPAFAAVDTSITGDELPE